MGIYYYLLNDTKQQTVHLDAHVKSGPMTMNAAVHYAFCNYMMENLGDSMRILSDEQDLPDYKDLDLLKYKFVDSCIMEKIVEKLNFVYSRQKYKVVKGFGVDTECT